MLRLCGIDGEEKSQEEIAAVLEERRAAWKPREPKYRTGALGLFTRNAASPALGGYLD